MKDTAGLKEEIELDKINERFAQDIDNYYQKAEGEFCKRHAQYIVVLDSSCGI
jgi:hypothetical protein